MKTLQDYCVDFIVPQRDKPKEFGGNIPWCRIEDIEGKYLHGTTSGQYVTQETINKMNLKIIPKGAVICSCSASLGVQAILTTPCITNQTFIGIVPKPELSSDFLYYFLKSKTNYFQKIGTGTTIPYISRKRFEQLPMPEITVSDQEKIVGILGKIESLITSRKQELKDLDVLIKSRVVEMFGTIQNNTYGFAVGTLGSVAEDFFAGGDKPSDCSEKKDDEHPYPVYANGYENGGLQGYSSKCRVYKPSVTISARGTIGYSFIREAGFTPVVRLITIVPNDKVSVVYLKYALDTMDIKSSGTSQAQLTVPNFRKEEIIVPPWDFQKQFAAFVAQVDKSKAVVQAALDKTQLLFDSLMQQYFG